MDQTYNDPSQQYRAIGLGAALRQEEDLTGDGAAGRVYSLGWGEHRKRWVWGMLPK